jgi:hypothetical protein
MTGAAAPSADPLRLRTRRLGTRRLGTRRLGTRRLGTRRWAKAPDTRFHCVQSFLSRLVNQFGLFVKVGRSFNTEFTAAQTGHEELQGRQELFEGEGFEWSPGTTQLGVEGGGLAHPALPSRCS